MSNTSSSSSSSSGGIGTAGPLGVVFIALKLTHVIARSWWWVLSPFWIPVALVIAILILFAIGYIIKELFF